MANTASGLSDGDVTETCCICGADGKLSFEHVPPRHAFNDHRVFEADIKKMLENGLMLSPKPDGRINQKGAGRFTVCVKCNNATGRWYGTPYITVAMQAMELLGIDLAAIYVGLSIPHVHAPVPEAGRDDVFLCVRAEPSAEASAPCSVCSQSRDACAPAQCRVLCISFPPS